MLEKRNLIVRFKAVRVLENVDREDFVPGNERGMRSYSYKLRKTRFLNNVRDFASQL